MHNIPLFPCQCLNISPWRSLQILLQAAPTSIHLLDYNPRQTLMKNRLGLQFVFFFPTPAPGWSVNAELLSGDRTGAASMMKPSRVVLVPHSDLSSLAAVWGPFHCFISTQRPMIHPTVTHQQILKLRTFIPTSKYTCTHAHSHRYVMKYIDSNQINHLYKHTHIYIFTHTVFTNYKLTLCKWSYIQSQVSSGETQKINGGSAGSASLL